ncbi:MAG: TIR domain-containing protein [Elusimicrobiota bacterium]
MSDEIKNVFMSHVHEDDPVLGDMKKLLGTQGYDIRDGSIDSSKPNEATNEDYIKNQILAPRIQWASTMIVLISPETHTSKWVEWEIEYAAKLGKRIVGVFVRGGMDSDVPKNLDLYGDAVVGWNSESVVDALTGKTNNWVSADGTPRDPRTIARYSCA